jgi:hypothetical protein
MIQYGVVLFTTTSSVMQAEKILLKAGFAIKLIPTPREFSADCGISIRFDWNKNEQTKAILEKEKVDYTMIQPLGPQGV